MATYEINGMEFESDKELTTEQLGEVANSFSGGQAQTAPPSLEAPERDSFLTSVGKSIVKAPLALGVTAAKAMGRGTEGSILDRVTGGDFSAAVNDGEFGNLDYTGDPLAIAGAVGETALNTVAAPIRGVGMLGKLGKTAVGAAPLIGKGRALQSAAKGALSMGAETAGGGFFSSLQDAPEERSVENTLGDTLKGGLFGAALGGTLGGATGIAERVTQPLQNKISAKVNDLIYKPDKAPEELATKAESIIGGADILRQANPKANFSNMNINDIVGTMKNTVSKLNKTHNEAIDEATSMGMRLDTAELDKKLADAALNTSTPEKKAAARAMEQYMTTIRANGSSPRAIADVIVNINNKLKKEYNADKMVTVKNQILKEYAADLRNVLDEAVDRKTYGKVYGDLMNTSELIKDIAQKNGMPLDGAEAIMDIFSDSVFAGMTGNPFYFVRSASGSSSNFLSKFFKNKKAMRDLREVLSGSDVGAKMPGKNVKPQNLLGLPEGGASSFVEPPTQAGFVADAEGGITRNLDTIETINGKLSNQTGYVMPESESAALRDVIGSVKEESLDEFNKRLNSIIDNMPRLRELPNG